jgi:putative membrane protein
VSDKLWLILRTSWDLHPSLLLAVGVLVTGYTYGLVRFRPGPGETRSHARIGTFALGIAILLVTLGSPLHHLSDDYLFSAHMTQHLLLTLIVPPILLMGTPSWMLRPLLRRELIERFGHSSAYPLLAFAIFNGVFTLAHIPVVYDVVFGNETTHRIAHIVFLFTAIFTWMPLASPVEEILPRLPQPGQMLYCFVQTLPGLLVGSLLTFTDQLQYRHYLPHAMELDVSPLTDQAVGGLLMWVIGGTFWLVVLTIVFFTWAEREGVSEWG